MSDEEKTRRSALRKWINDALSSHLSSVQHSSRHHHHEYEHDDDHLVSTSSSYLELISTVRNMSNPLEIKRLCIVLVGCLGTVALHSNHFQDLVHALLEVGWVRCHEGTTVASKTTVAQCYVAMLSHLVSQNSCFLPPCFTMLVRNLFFEEENLPPKDDNDGDDNDTVEDESEDGSELMSEDINEQEENEDGRNSGGSRLSTAATTATTATAPITATTATADAQRHAAYQKSSQAQFMHQTIREMLRIAPLYAGVLMQVLEESAPHSRLSRQTQKSFVVHALHMTEYVPALMYRVLVIVVDRMIAIDVAIKLEDVVREQRAVQQNAEEEASKDNDEEEHEDEEMFAMEEEHQEEEEISNRIERPRMLSSGTESRAQMTNEMAGKLDVMMDVLFHYLARHMAPVSSSSGGSSDVAPSHQLFELLLRVFEDTILNTYRSKYVQFLIFYTCQYDVSYVELYVSRMVGRMIHAQSPIVTQRACAAYLASFLSRAKYVKPMAVASSLHHMVVWASAYVTAREPTAAGQQQHYQYQQEHQHQHQQQHHQHHAWLPGAKQHETFYSICQACFYIICFVGLEYLTKESDAPSERQEKDRVTQLLHQLPWMHVIFSPLDPLKYCLHDVRNEFVNVSRATRLLGARQEELEIRVSHIMETMDHESAGRGSSGSVEIGRKGGNALSDDFASNGNPLDSFFPYDPYLLSISSSHVDPLYVVWSRNDEDKDEDEDKSEDNADAHNDMHMLQYDGSSSDGVTNGNSAAATPHMIAIPQARRRTNSFFATGGGDEGEDLFGSNAAWGDDRWEEGEDDEVQPMSLVGGSMSPDGYQDHGAMDTVGGFGSHENSGFGKICKTKNRQ